jgi:hypothetical protein
VDPLSVKTVASEEEEALEFKDESASLAKFESSMSKYDRPASTLPRWCAFGPKDCWRMFDMGSHKGAFSRVCGRAVATCTARHPPIKEKAEVGYYKPIKARKYVNGKLHTFLAMEDYAAMEQRQKEPKTMELKQASDFFSDLGGSPTGSKEAEYAHL